jgi:hypothetical protein
VPPACATCFEDELCIRVLDTPAIVLGVGEAVDLLTSRVTFVNLFPATARVTDTWTVNTFNAGSDEETVRYKIRGTSGLP